MDTERQFGQAASLYQRGDLAGAQTLAEAVLAVQPHHANSNFLLGVIAAQGTQYSRAYPFFERAIQARPKEAQYYYNYGLALQQGGRLEEALAAYTKATRLQPDFVVAHNNRGIALRDLGRETEALQAYERAIALNPDFAEAHNNRGWAFMSMGRWDEALAACERAVELKPGYAEAHNNRGAVLGALGRHEEALAAYEHVLALDPAFAEAYNNRGEALRNLGRDVDALQAYERALELQPDFMEAHNNRALALLRLGRLDEALVACERAIQLQPDFAGMHMTHGSILTELNRLDEAIASYHRSLELQPTSVKAHTSIGHALRALGRFEEAERSFRDALRLEPDSAKVHFSLMLVHKSTVDDELIAQMEQLYASADTAPDSRMHLGFALGKAYSDLKDYDRAMTCYEAANRLVRATFEYSSEKDAEKEEFLRDLFTPEYVSRNSNNDLQDDTPVFIVGMPRSGTTLVEQILASHPQVAAAGELRFLQQVVSPDAPGELQNWRARWADPDPGLLAEMGNEYLRKIRVYGRPGARLITDKMPGNFWNVGFIRLILPNARIIHLRRDARDTCLSIYTHWFRGRHKYAYDLAELGRYYRLYSALMEHWKTLFPGQIHDVAYDALVQDLEGEVRRLLDYCGLPFDDRCLSFHETERAVKTASFSQVRQPVYQTSRGRWRPYEKMLQPLLSVLEQDQ